MIQLTLTLNMTTAQVVETSVIVNNNSPIQNYVHPNDQTQPTFEMTPGFKPFTILKFLREYGKKGENKRKFHRTQELNVYLSEFIIAARTNVSRLLTEESYQALTVILQGANMGKGYSLISNFRDWAETHWKQSKKWNEKKAEEIGRMQLLLSQKRKLIFSLKKKRTWEQVLHNRYWTLCGSLIVSEVAQNNEIYVGAMLFWRLTVKAKIYIFIQRGKLRADRATTHGMLDLWNRECMKIKSQCEIFPFVLLNLWTSYENRDTVEFVGRSKYCLEISKTWERLACFSPLRSSSAS